MLRKVAFGLIWISFVTYALIFAPPNQPDTFELIKNMSTGEFAGINPLIIALFNLMGILPIIYGCMLFIDGRGQKIPAWLFVGASFALGAFALLPYLALRQNNSSFEGKKDWFLQLQDSRWLGCLLTVAAIGLIVYGSLKGDWADFAQQWQTSRFIHVMSLDFCLLCVLFPTLLGDDLARRGVENPLFFRVVSLFPLVGALLYLCLRPPLVADGEQLQLIKEQVPIVNQ